jgi:hypothetical protein
VATLKRGDDLRKRFRKARNKRPRRGVPDPHPDYCRSITVKRAHDDKVFVFGDENGACRHSMGPNVSVRGVIQPNLSNMTRFMPMVGKMLR